MGVGSILTLPLTSKGGTPTHPLLSHSNINLIFFENINQLWSNPFSWMIMDVISSYSSNQTSWELNINEILSVQSKLKVGKEIYTRVYYHYLPSIERE
jgi:hypothetical protein